MASPPTPPGSILSARSNRWPIRSSLVRRYLMLFGLGATCDGTRSTMRSPNLRSRRRGVRGRRHAGPKRSLESSRVLSGPLGSSRVLSGPLRASRPLGSSRVLSAHPASPENFFGLFDMRRMSRMPRSARICAPVPYSRESTGKPSCKFASSVSTPCSCSAYACLRPGGTRTCLAEETSRLPPVCLPSASRLPLGSSLTSLPRGRCRAPPAPAGTARHHSRRPRSPAAPSRAAARSRNAETQTRPPCSTPSARAPAAPSRPQAATRRDAGRWGRCRPRRRSCRRCGRRVGS